MEKQRSQKRSIHGPFQKVVLLQQWFVIAFFVFHIISETNTFKEKKNNSVKASIIVSLASSSTSCFILHNLRG